MDQSRKFIQPLSSFHLSGRAVKLRENRRRFVSVCVYCLPTVPRMFACVRPSGTSSACESRREIKNSFNHSLVGRRSFFHPSSGKLQKCNLVVKSASKTSKVAVIR